MNFIKFILVFSLTVCPFFYGVAFSMEKASSFQNAQKIKLDVIPDFDKKNPQAKGVILSFDHWPNIKDKELIIEHFKKAGLTKKAQIERFKVLAFDWSEWRTVTEAKKVCENLPNISSLKNCEPDYLIDTAIYTYNRASDARERITKAKEGLTKAEAQFEYAKQRLSEMEEKVSRIRKQMATDKGLVVEKQRVRKAEFALKQAKKKLEQVRQAGKDDKIAKWNVQHLIKLVESRKKRVENRKKWFQNTKKYIEDNQNSLLEHRKSNFKKAEKWLENRKQYLAKTMSKYGPYLESGAVQTNDDNLESRGTTHSNPDDVVASDDTTIPQQNENQEGLRSCNFVSSEVGLFEDQLSDYWAQEMVGSDLLKEELKKTSPVEKHLVEVFDVPPSHDIKVRNLISDEGAHSVLPEIGDKAGITHTPTSFSGLVAADRLLSKVEDECIGKRQPPQSGGEVSSGGGGGGVASGGSRQGSSERGVASKKGAGQGGGGSGQDSSGQGGSSGQIYSRQDSSTQEQETVTHEETEYIMLRGWSNNRDFKISSVIGHLGREGITIQQVTSPHVAGLKAAGESYSSTVHAISQYRG